MAALQLLRLCRDNLPIAIVLIEKRAVTGPGLAYSASTDSFKLNVHANSMGAWPEFPADFFQWLKANNFQVEEHDFVPRSLYGRYLTELLAQEQATSHANTLTLLHAEVLAVRPLGATRRFQLELEHSAPQTVDAVILAVGNLERSSLGALSTLDLFMPVYNACAYEQINTLTHIVVVGSGLSAVDFVLEAEKQGFTGRYSLLSRHGLLPLPHAGASTLPKTAAISFQIPCSLRNLLQQVRKVAREVGSSQPVIEALRPNIQALWKAFSVREKRTFLRHLRAIWDCHRHRIPENHHVLLERLQTTGRLRLLKGKIVSAARTGKSSEICVLPRGQRELTERLVCERLVMCAGFESDLTRCSSPLIANLLATKLIKAGELGLGVQTYRTAVECAGSHRGLFVIGPLQRETLWEVTAVRELRKEAVSVAAAVSEYLSTRRLDKLAKLAKH